MRGFTHLGQRAILLLALTTTACAVTQHEEDFAKAIVELERAAESDSKLYAVQPITVNPAKGKVKTSKPNRLSDFLAMALKQNRELAAAAHRVEARVQRIPQVTSLPDPFFKSRVLPTTPVRTAEGDNSVTLGISQKLPIPSKLKIAGRIALSESQVALARLRELRLRVVADVKRLYFALYVVDKTILITNANQDVLRGLIGVARAQVAVGKRPQDDVLRAQVELSNLEAQLIALRQRRVSVVARLNELVNRPPQVAIPVVADFKIRNAKLKLDAVLARAVVANPSLIRVREQIGREEKALELAELGYWPDFLVGAEWMQMDPRTGGNRLSKDGSDNYAFTFGFNIPISFGRIRGRIREAEKTLSGARETLSATRNRVSTAVRDSLERFRAQRELAKLFRDTIIPQAQQTYEVSQASYTTGATDFLNVIDNWRKWLVFTVQYHRALGELERSVADLEQAIGLSLAGLDKNNE